MYLKKSSDVYLKKFSDMYLTIYVGMVWVEQGNSSSAQHGKLL